MRLSSTTLYLLLAVLASIASVACVPQDDEINIAAEPLSARVTCESHMVDLTPAEITDKLVDKKLNPVGRCEDSRLADGRRISRQLYRAEDDGLLRVSVTCESSCEGDGCSVLGCDAWDGGCTACTCSGIDCPACTCKKNSALQ